MNYFDCKSAAERYARGRPYFHRQVIARIKNYLDSSEKLNKIVDVGCGTGLSTMALKEISNKAYGTDSSKEMIKFAITDPAIDYIVSLAEYLPFKKGKIDMITVSSAFHWFIRDKFLYEARRILKENGWLILYNNRFFAEMLENVDFKKWMDKNYGKYFPTPPKVNVEPFGANEAKKEGFYLEHIENYENIVTFSISQLVDYLTTHTNIIAKVDRGDANIETVKNFLTGEIGPLFKKKKCSFRFGGEIEFYRKIE